jgi:thiamine biosynthesis lipoprotein
MHKFKAMNTNFQTWHLRKEDEAKVEQWIHFVEAKLSRFQPDSELSQMNRAQGRPFIMSPLLFEAMSEAIKYYKQTDGLFNPFMGRIIEGLGYGKSFEMLQPEPVFDLSDHWAALDHPFRLDKIMKSITLDKDVHVDLGGIAKAWSANYMAKQLRKGGVKAGAINAGGDIISWGEHDSYWSVSIAHPTVPDKDVVTINAKRGFGVATSSRVKRSWRDQLGNLQNHLIDPRTHEATKSDLLQVSVLSPDLTVAEIYTKCILILGSEQGIPWFHSIHPELAVVAVKDDLSLITSGDFSPYTLERND